MEIKAHFSENGVKWDYDINTINGIEFAAKNVVKEYGREPQSMLRAARAFRRWEAQFDGDVSTYCLKSGLAQNAPSKANELKTNRQELKKVEEMYYRLMLLPFYRRLNSSVAYLKQYAKEAYDKFDYNDESTQGEGFADKELQKLMLEVEQDFDALYAALLVHDTCIGVKE